MPADTRLTLDSSESAELNSKVVFTSSSAAASFSGFVVSVSVLQIVTFLKQKWKDSRLYFSVCQKYIIPFSAVNLVEVWRAFGRISQHLTNFALSIFDSHPMIFILQCKFVFPGLRYICVKLLQGCFQFSLLFSEPALQLFILIFQFPAFIAFQKKALFLRVH